MKFQEWLSTSEAESIIDTTRHFHVVDDISIEKIFEAGKRNGPTPAPVAADVAAALAEIVEVVYSDPRLMNLIGRKRIESARAALDAAGKEAGR